MIDPAAIEAVARAICEANGGKPDDIFGGSDGSMRTPEWEFSVPSAKMIVAAIEAYSRLMRERTMG